MMIFFYDDSKYIDSVTYFVVIFGGFLDPWSWEFITSF